MKVLVLTNVGITFAIRMDNVMGIIHQLMTTGRVIRPWLGLRMVSLSPNIIQQLGPMDDGRWTDDKSRRKGVLVTSVFAGSPAERGGLLEGDVIFAINKKPVEKTYEFLKALGHKITEVELQVERRIPLGRIPLTFQMWIGMDESQTMPTRKYCSRSDPKSKIMRLNFNFIKIQS